MEPARGRGPRGAPGRFAAARGLPARIGASFAGPAAVRITIRLKASLATEYSLGVSTTAERRAAIRSILAEGEVRNQYELEVRLKKKGHHASQPVLSRDLRALGVAKQSGVYQLVESERVTPLTSLKSLLRAVEAVPHFVMVHCEPGAASAVARALEAEEVPGLIGSVAGDDTVLVAVSSAAVGQRVRRRVAELLESNT